MIFPPSIIGYFGNAEAPAIEKKLDRPTVTAHRQRTLRFSDTVAVLAHTPETNAIRIRSESESGLEISLSASGLASDEDASVGVFRSRLRLRRDPFGRVALFWTKTDSGVWFSSHLQPLVQILETSRLDRVGLYGYDCFSFVPTPRTPIHGVFSVPAGADIEWNVGDESPRTVRRHEWREASSVWDDEAKAVSTLRCLLAEATDALLADRPAEPVGVFLSGGLDSSISAALLARAGVKVRAYTLDFGEYGVSEVPQAQAVADALAVPLVKVPASPKHVRRAIEATARALPQPFGDPVTVPLYLLGEAARRDGISVVFNGEGGDQLFAGWTNKPLIASGIYRDHQPDETDLTTEYLRTFHRLYGHETDVYTPAVLQEIRAVRPETWIRSALDDSFCRSFLHRMRRAGLALKGAQNIQPRATYLAWAHGLSVRSPFCVPRLAEWTFLLSGDLCLRGSCEKYLLKRAVEDWLPAEIVWREKRGMGVPVTEWCLGPLWSEVGRHLHPEALKQGGVFVPDIALKTALGRLGPHIRSRRIGETLWLLLMRQAWKTATFNEKPPPMPVVGPFRIPFRLYSLLRTDD